MDVLDTKKIEECLDQTMIYEFVFRDPVGEDHIRILGKGGELSYHPEFLRPFFTLTTADGIQVKGIVGDRSIQVIFPLKSGEEGVKAFAGFLEKIGNGPR